MVLERRGQRRRRQCLKCGRRWTTMESLVGIKPVSLPPVLAKLSTQSKPVRRLIRQESKPIDDAPDDPSDVDEYLHSNLPELFNGR